MKTRFFFPVVAMIAFATVNNAAAFKVGGTTPRMEVASVEKVDARAGAETSVCGERLKGLTSVLACGAETSVCGTRFSGLTSGFKTSAEASVCGERQKGLTSVLACGAETSIQVAAVVDGRATI